jgi:hypothetical protein
VADWFWQKVDVFVAAVFVALAGIAACQGHEVMVQYLQRLSTNENEARLHLTDTQSGLRYRVMGDEVRAELEADAKTRFDQLHHALDFVARANPLIRPLALVKTHDSETLTETWRDFKPAVPATAGGAVYAFLGMLVGFVVYEVLKLPIVVVRNSRRRRFRRRG